MSKLSESLPASWSPRRATSLAKPSRRPGRMPRSRRDTLSLRYPSMVRGRPTFPRHLPLTPRRAKVARKEARRAPLRTRTTRPRTCGSPGRAPRGRPRTSPFASDNAKGGCKKGAKCHFTHVCSLCFGSHPKHQCPTASAAKAADTQGANA